MTQLHRRELFYDEPGADAVAKAEAPGSSCITRSFRLQCAAFLRWGSFRMPIYEYRCESCGAEIEKLQKISDPLLRDCAACGKPALVKRVSASSFRLKGGGWYETDFKTGKKKNGVGDAEVATDKASGATGSTADSTIAGAPNGIKDGAAGSPSDAAA